MISEEATATRVFISSTGTSAVLSGPKIRSVALVGCALARRVPGRVAAVLAAVAFAGLALVAVRAVNPANDRPPYTSAASYIEGIPGDDPVVEQPGFLDFNQRLEPTPLELPVEARPAVHAMVEKGVLGGVSLGRLYPGADALRNGLVVAVTEVVSDEDIDALEAALKEVCQ